MATSIPAKGRNVLVTDFLAGDSDWLWMVDSDMVFDKGHAMKLVITARDMDVKIVSGLAFIFRDNSQPIPSWFTESSGKFYPKGELHLIENQIPDEPCVVAATGLASTLVHRDVFEAMEAPRDERWRWFDHIPLDGNDGLAGEDVQFFIRAREAGFDTVLEPRAETWHIKSIGVGRDSFDRFWELRRREFDQGAA
jgi:GT2 family glycosyltransferase